MKHSRYVPPLTSSSTFQLVSSLLTQNCVSIKLLKEVPQLYMRKYQCVTSILFERNYFPLLADMRKATVKKKVGITASCVVCDTD